MNDDRTLGFGFGGSGVSPQDKRAALWGLLRDGESHLVPTTYDAFTAAIVEEQGFQALHFSGYYASAAIAGSPDIGLLSMSEMVSACRSVCMRSTLPVIADADDGYGGPLQVARTVIEFESIGVAGLHLEDQTAPKRCGLMDGITVISTEVMCEKLRAAAAARTDPSLLLIARTDARGPEGLDAALARAVAYREAGADVSYVKGIRSQDELRAVSEALPAPRITGWSAFGPSSGLRYQDYKELGFSLMLFPDAPLAIHRVLSQVHAALRQELTADQVLPQLSSYDEMNQTMKLSVWRELEDRVK